MRKLTRREVLKSGVAVSAGMGIPAVATARPVRPSRGGSGAGRQPAGAASGCWFDFGWRFHLGHASDPAQRLRLRWRRDVFQVRGPL